jgi:hypothetical protein
MEGDGIMTAMQQDIAESVMLAGLDTQFVCESFDHQTDPPKAMFMQFADCPCLTGPRCTACVKYNRTRKTIDVFCKLCGHTFPRTHLQDIPIGDNK